MIALVVVLLGAPALAALLALAVSDPTTLARIAAAATLLSLAAAMALAYGVSGGTLLTAAGGLLHIDAFSVIALLALTVLSAATTAAAASESEARPRLRHALRLALVSALAAVPVAGDLGMLWLAAAAVALLATALAGASLGPPAVDAAWRGAIVAAAALALALVGTLLAGLANPDPAPFSPALLGGLLLTAGYATLAGAAPLHSWIPALCRQASPSAAALISGALPVTGFYALLRAAPGDGIPVLGLLSLVAAIALALHGADRDRRLDGAAIGLTGLALLAMARGLPAEALLLVTAVACARALLRLSVPAGPAGAAPIACGSFALAALAHGALPPGGTFFGAIAVLSALSASSGALAALVLAVLAASLRATVAALREVTFEPLRTAPREPWPRSVARGALALALLAAGLPFLVEFRGKALSASAVGLDLQLAAAPLAEPAKAPRRHFIGPPAPDSVQP